jgi:hypothetical protein
MNEWDWGRWEKLWKNYATDYYGFMLLTACDGEGVGQYTL